MPEKNVVITELLWSLNQALRRERLIFNIAEISLSQSWLAFGQSRFLVEVSLCDDSFGVLSRGNPRPKPNVPKGRFDHGSK